MLKPTRVIFNYAARCNMPCQFCYIPFNGVRTALADRLVAIDRVAAMGAELITFGGGDPLLDRDLEAVFAHTASHGIKIQLDTNGLLLNTDTLPLLQRYVSFMSLPLEGDADTHTLMRGNKKHFAHVLDTIPRVLDAGIRLKINTVACTKNLHALPALAETLSPFAQRTDNPLARWSIYEFIPAERGEMNRIDFEMAPGRFHTAMQALRQQFPALPIEPGARSTRKSAYFFMNDNGTVYATNPAPDRDSTIFLGHIMDDDIQEKWSALIEGTDHGDRFKDRATLRLGLT
ncbi:radical SAM protein [Micavibrio aeruginosavorus]|uniref:radical SAM protein n=1 Tax=Micavibrio aeruginosavorus TaxID=349221 RepID=UPI003F4AC382